MDILFPVEFDLSLCFLDLFDMKKSLIEITLLLLTLIFMFASALV